MSKIKHDIVYASVTVKSKSTGNTYKVSKKPMVKTNPGKARRTA